MLPGRLQLPRIDNRRREERKRKRTPEKGDTRKSAIIRKKQKNRKRTPTFLPTPEKAQ
jgi:hypothetical protein